MIRHALPIRCKELTIKLPLGYMTKLPREMYKHFHHAFAGFMVEYSQTAFFYKVYLQEKGLTVNSYRNCEAFLKAFEIS